VTKALQFEITERYQNAMEMLDALERWKPGQRPASSKQMAPDFSKEALGHPQLSRNEELGDLMAQQSIELKKHGRLSEAADMMEEAFNKWPDLRHKYAPQVKLWRCGISM
jgi:serine/threonine-protein kinase